MEDRQWTGKEIIKGKTLPFMVLTIIFTYIMNNVANNALTYLLNIKNTSLMTTNYSFGILGIVAVVPAALISIWIIKITLKIRCRFISVSDEPTLEYKHERKQSQEKKFKWYNIYGIILGYFFLIFLFNISNKLIGYTNNMNPFLSAIIYIGMMVASIITSVIGVKILNKTMVEKTNTNRDLLDDIQEGLYDSDFVNIQEKNQTTKLLETGTIGSVKNALKYLKIQRWLKTIGKASAFVTGLLFLVTFGVADFVGGEISTSNTGSSSNRFRPSFGRNSEIKKQEKNDALWKANQKQKEADYARSQAIKQAQYNPNTHYMNKKYNHAKYKQNEANDAYNKAKDL